MELAGKGWTIGESLPVVAACTHLLVAVVVVVWSRGLFSLSRLG